MLIASKASKETKKMPKPALKYPVHIFWSNGRFCNLLDQLMDMKKKQTKMDCSGGRYRRLFFKATIRIQYQSATIAVDFSSTTANSKHEIEYKM